MKRMRLAIALCAAAACLLARPSVHGQKPPAGAQAQPPQQPPQQPEPPTFKSTTTLVEVHAIVTDKAGAFVPTLTADDLTLSEDGKPQRIDQFYLVTYTPGRNLESPYADLARFRGPRVFVLLFDEAHLAPDSLLRVQKGAERFIEEQMAPGDLGGVFVNNGMWQGRMSTEKSDLLGGVHAVHAAIETRQSLLAPFREFPRIPTENDAMRVADGGLELANRLAVEACRTQPAECANLSVRESALQQVENLIQQKSRRYVRSAGILTAQTVQNLRAVTAGLTRLQGRKTIFFLTEGFYVEESRGVLERIGAEAARGGTTIYSIDGRGNINTMSGNTDVVSASAPRSPAFDTGEDGPNILTAGTGGFMVRHTDDMNAAFGRIANDTSTYYVIGYQPENAALDGKIRKIDLKTKRRDLTVRARRSYAAVPLPPQQSLWAPK